MNHDRLLIRVYDKQTKKMYYPLQNELIDDEYNLLACNATHLIARPINREDAISYIPYKDRFVPMQCTGKRDKNTKLIYECNFVTGYCPEPDASNTEITRGIVTYNEDSWDFGIYQYDGKFICELSDLHNAKINGVSLEALELLGRKLK